MQTQTTTSLIHSQTRFFFFLNNYKIQTMLLVSQGLKLFWYLTNQVQRSRFWGINRVYCTRFPIA